MGDEIVITNTRPEHASALAAMQRLSYPTLAEEELLAEQHYLRHIELFPEGQFVALDDARPVGSTTTFRVNFDFAHPAHKFGEITDHGWLGNHTPDGEWLYGADVMTHPDYRRRGIARKLYMARFELVRRLGLRGQIAGGMIPGYHNYADRYSIKDYIEKVVAGELTDPTLTAQLKVGFQYITPLYEYLLDESSHHASALIVWDNPDFAR